MRELKKITVRIGRDLYDDFQLLRRKQGVSFQTLIQDAMGKYLSGDDLNSKEMLLVRDLRSLHRKSDYLKQDFEQLSETLALFVEVFLTSTDPPDGEKRAEAARRGKARMEAFCERLVGRLVEGKSFLEIVFIAQSRRLADDSELSLKEAS